MKVLLIGSADSIWIKKIIELTFIPFGDDVTIYTDSNTAYADYYRSNNIKIIMQKPGKSPFSALLLNFRHMLKKYDLVHVHYVTSLAATLGMINSVFSRRFVLTFWGSDLFRVEKAKKPVRLALNFCSAVTMSTAEMRDRFRKDYGRSFNRKLKRAVFGVNGFDTLRSVNPDKTALRKKYGIPENKTVVSVGYSCKKEHQHLPVLSAIRDLPEELRSGIHILLRMTYGCSDKSYPDKVKKAVSETGCTYSIYESFLSDEDTAELTLLTDIFIHAQVTDAKSATLCEHLYARCFVLNPSWIKYSDLENRVFYQEYDSFEQLKGMLADVLRSLSDEDIQKRLAANTAAICKLCSWDSFIPQWRAVYTGKKLSRRR